jgi:hypothetical protein
LSQDVLLAGLMGLSLFLKFIMCGDMGIATIHGYLDYARLTIDRQRRLMGCQIDTAIRQSLRRHLAQTTSC